MKKILSYIAFGAVAVVSASCSVNQMTPQVSSDTRVQMEFTAGTVDTKTSINDLEVLWSAGDAISVFDGTNNNRFDLTGGEGTKSATFSGLAETVSEYVALYPYSANASFAGNTITATLPAEQYSTVGGSFDTMLNPAVAKSSDNTLTFRNIAGLIRINVTNVPEGLGIREIQAKAATSLTGEYTVNTSGDDFEAVASGDEVNGVRLVAKDGGELAEGAYNLVVLPGEYANFKVTIILTDGSYIAKGGENAPVATIPANGGIDITIDASDPTTVSRGLYDLFNDGEDIYIAGKAYNKSQFSGEGQIDLYTSNNSSIYAGGNLGDDDIIFLTPESIIKNIGNLNNVIIVGTDPSNKPLINKIEYSYLQTTNAGIKRLIIANVKIDASAFTSSQNYLFAANGGTFDELVFDNCDIILPATKFLVSIPNNTAINNIVINNCNFIVPESTTNRYIIHTGTAKTTVQCAEFRNNIFYCGADNAIVTNFRVFSGNTYDSSGKVTNYTDVNKFVFENNTLINLDYQNSALLVANNVYAASIKNNLIYIDQQNTNKNARNLLIATGTYPEANNSDCRDNIVYDTNITNNSPAFNMFYHSQYNNGVLGVSPTVIPSSPLAEENYDDCRFTPTPEYASYGAQR